MKMRLAVRFETSTGIERVTFEPGEWTEWEAGRTYMEVTRDALTKKRKRRKQRRHPVIILMVPVHRLIDIVQEPVVPDASA